MTEKRTLWGEIKGFGPLPVLVLLLICGQCVYRGWGSNLSSAKAAWWWFVNWALQWVIYLLFLAVVGLFVWAWKKDFGDDE